MGDHTQTVTTWLDGVTLEVEDVERSLEFYRSFPGSSVSDHIPGRFALVQMGSAHVNILHAGAPGLLFGGSRGFHLEVLTRELDELHARFSSSGIRPLGPPKDRHWGERAFDLVDPDGNHVELGGR